MINLVTTMSRYLMILLILIYTYYNFRFFSLPDDESKLRLCRLQNIPLFLIFLLSGTIIYLQTEDVLPADFRLHKCNRKPDIQTFSYSFLLESY